MKLKKFEQKDRYGNMFSIEFDTSVPEMSSIPDHPGDPKGTDTVPAWLTPGEFVMNAEAVRMFEPQIEAMNDKGRAMQAAQGGTIPEYASDGGFIQNFVDKFTMPKPPAGSGIEYRRHKDGSIGMWAGNTYRGKYQEPKEKEKTFSNMIGISYNNDGGPVSLPKPKPKMPNIPALEADQLYKMLKSRGFTDVAARGIMGNFYAESKLDPDAKQILDGGKTGKGRGLAQWEKGGRFDTDPLNLVDFAAEQEKSWRDPEVQLDFMLAEMNNSEAFGDVRTAMNAAESPADAAKIFLEGYEKANPKKAHLDKRVDYAMNYQAAEEPTVLASIMNMFGTTEAQAATADNLSVPEAVSVPKPLTPEVSRTPVMTAMTGQEMPVTSTIADMLAAAQTQYKAPGGIVEDDNYAAQYEALKKLAQQATANTGMYVGDEVLEEGGTNYDAARHAEEIQMMQKMRRDSAIAEDAAANEAAMLTAATPPIPKVSDVPAPIATPEVRSINKFGKTDNYQKEGGKWYRIKADGSLARDPATGLVAANLNNQESPITGEGTASAVPMPTSDLPSGSRGSGELLDTGKGKRVPDTAAPPKPEQKSQLPAEGTTYLDPSSNIVYTVDKYGRLLNSYGHPAPAGVQDTFTQQQAGLLETADADPSKIVKPYEKTVDQLAADAVALQEKATKEVAETGQVSSDTATAIAQNKGQATQVTKVETDEAAAAEAKRLEEATAARKTLTADYEEAKRIAEASGVTDFPDFDTWKQRQNIDTDTDIGEQGDGTTTSENATQKSEVLTAITKDIESINDGSADGTTTADASKAVVKAGAEGQEKTEQAESFLQGIFGDLFDKGELKRMAILYAGSRLMGGSHGGSLNWAAKQYLTRVDAKAADHSAQVKKLINDGKYTPKSIQEYKRTKDASVLMKLGPAINPTGTKEMWYSPSGKRIQAEKFKVGDGHIWSADGGKTAIPASWTQEASRHKGTDEYNDRIRAEVPLLKDSIKELSTAIGDVVPGDSKAGRARTQKTNITPTNAAMEAAEWAAKNNLDVASMNTYVEQAYRMAVEQSGGENNVKPESLLPYLNQLKLRQDTGVGNLFTTTTKDGADVPMDAVKVEELSLQFLKRAGGTGKISDGANRDAVNMFWTKAAEIWNKKVSETPDIVQQYQKRALPGETAFYAYAKEQLNLPTE